MVDPGCESFYEPIASCGDAALAAACAAAPGQRQAEDSFVLDTAARVFAVADGLGAHAGGGLAACLAAAAVRRTVRARRPIDADGAQALANAAFAAAEEDIGRRARSEAGLRRMGVSMVLACVLERQLCVAHVGDARAYLHGRLGLRRLTEDHTGVGELLHAGLLDEGAAGRHAARAPLFRTVGGNKRIDEPAFGRHALDACDAVMLCSDGVWAWLAPQVMAGVLDGGGSAAEQALALVRAARGAGSRDDACAVVCLPQRLCPQEGA